MKLIRFLFRYSPGLIALATLIGILGGVASAVLMALINAHLRGAPVLRGDLWKFGGLCLVVLAANFMARIGISGLSQWSIFDLRLQLSRKWLTAPLPELERAGSAKILAAITQDVDSLAAAMQALPGICIDLTVVVACLIYLGYLSWVMLLVMIGFTAVAIATRSIPEKKCEQLMSQARRYGEAMLESFNAMASGIKELKLNRARWQAFYSGELYDVSTKYRDRRYQAATLFGLIRGYSEIIYFLFVGLLLFGTPLFGQLSLKVVVGFAVTLLYVKTNIDHIQDSVSQIVQAQVALANLESMGVFKAKSSLSLSDLRLRTTREKVVHELDAEVSQYAAGGTAACRKIEFQGVEYKYEGNREEAGFSVGPIDLSVQAGEVVFVTGGNGSGKTTFAKLLCGLYSPSAGQIRLDGTPITDENRSWFSQHFGAVFSDFHLFDKLYGHQDFPQVDSVVRSYLEELRLQHKVEVKNGCLSTTSLSQGQRKRLALLTSYVEDRPIYLFDEWAADQEPAFRDVFYYQILASLKAKGKTVFVISHDDRYYHVADRLLRLESGVFHEANQAPALIAAEIGAAARS
jgi:putative ATP-binding cassette transporter